MKTLNSPAKPRFSTISFDSTRSESFSFSRHVNCAFAACSPLFPTHRMSSAACDEPLRLQFSVEAFLFSRGFGEVHMVQFSKKIVDKKNQLDSTSNTTLEKACSIFMEFTPPFGVFGVRSSLLNYEWLFASKRSEFTGLSVGHKPVKSPQTCKK